MRIVADIAALRSAVAAARSAGRAIGLVPTMGFLHEGHLTLCDVARQHADFLVMSSFVNPLQFGAGEDLDRYPRNAERDARLAEDRGVDIMFAPTATAMYPDGAAEVRVMAPALSDRLCGRFRPGHFEGVLTVVAKLFNIVAPDTAVFGRKDLQQLALVRRMVRDLNFPIEIVAAPIIREDDGLALSSRNVYLDTEGRAHALFLSGALTAAQEAFSNGETDPAALVAATAAVFESAAGVDVQYIELVDADTLDVPAEARAGHAVAMAAHVGGTRLIDNHILE